MSDHTTITDVGQYGTSASSLLSPSFRTDTLYTFDSVTKKIRSYDATNNFTYITEKNVSQKVANIVEIPGLKLIGFKVGDPSVKFLRFVDEDLVNFTKTGFEDITLTTGGADPYFVTAVDPKHPYMAFFDPGAPNASALITYEISNVCSENCDATAGCNHFPNANSEGCIDCKAGLAFDSNNFCVDPANIPPPPTTSTPPPPSNTSTPSNNSENE